MNPNDFLNLKNKLKATKTVVKEMPKGSFEEEEKRVALSSPINVLYLTTNWAIYQWLGPKTEIKKILCTTIKNKELMSQNDLEEYEHIEFFEDYNSPLLEFKAFQLNQKYKFDSVMPLFSFFSF